MLVEGEKIIGKVGGASAVIGAGGFGPVPLLDDVSRLGESWDQLTADQPGGTSSVVEMQMGEHHHINVGGLESVLLQAWEQTASRHGEQGPAAWRVLGAYAGVDQDVLVAGPNEQAVEGYGNAILAVDRREVTPQRSGHYSEQAASIETDLTVGDDVDIYVAYFHGLAFMVLPSRPGSPSRLGSGGPCLTRRGWTATALVAIVSSFDVD